MPGGGSGAGPINAMAQRTVTTWPAGSPCPPVDGVVCGVLVVFVGERDAGGRRDALKVTAGALGAGVPLDHRPEVLPVTGCAQVRQLMDQYVVDDPARHRTEPVGQADGAVGRSAGTPLSTLVGDPANTRRADRVVQVEPSELAGAGLQLSVAPSTPAPALA